MNTAFDEYVVRPTAHGDISGERVHAPGHVLAFPRGGIVFDAGDPAQAMFRLEEGFVRIVRLAPDGYTQTIRHVLPGDFFGEEALFEATHLDTLEALTDASVRAIDPRFLDQHDLLVIVQSLGRQIQRLMDDGYHLQTGDLHQRVARYLVSLSDTALCRHPPGAPPTVYATHELIAQGTASTRESVSKIITELREEGLIGTGYRAISLLDLEGLQEIAGTY
jgi:CRP-like cAMP-binding protein